MFSDVGSICARYRRIWRAARIVALYPLANILASLIVMLGNQLAPNQVASDLQIAHAGWPVLFGALIASIIILSGYLTAGSYRLVWCIFGLLASIPYSIGVTTIAVSSFSTTPSVNLTLFVYAVEALSAVLLIVGFWSVFKLTTDVQKPFAQMKLFDVLVRLRRQTYSSLKKYWFVIVPICVLVFALIAVGGLIGSYLINRYLFLELYDADVSTVDKLTGLADRYPLQFFLMNLIGLVGYAAVPVAVMLSVNLGKRLMQRQANELIKTTNYKPVVFLRSFQDESVKVRPISYVRLLSRYFPRLEQVIVNTLAKLGPPIAIGLPGERVPPLGAMRAYYSDSEWQAALGEWIARSHLIAVMLGSTPWALWEINHLLTIGQERKLIVVVPHDRDAERGQNRWEKFVDALSETRWSNSLKAVAPAGLRTLVFLPDGDVHGFRSAGARQADYEYAIRAGVVKLFAPSA